MWDWRSSRTHNFSGINVKNRVVSKRLNAACDEPGSYWNVFSGVRVEFTLSAILREIPFSNLNGSRTRIIEQNTFFVLNSDYFQQFTSKTVEFTWIFPRWSFITSYQETWLNRSECVSSYCLFVITLLWFSIELHWKCDMLREMLIESIECHRRPLEDTMKPDKSAQVQLFVEMVFSIEAISIESYNVSNPSNRESMFPSLSFWMLGNRGSVCNFASTNRGLIRLIKH